MRLIDADALANYANNQIVGITANDIMRFPTVDAEPVKHGRWLIRGIDKLVPTGKIAVSEGHILSKTSSDEPFTLQSENLIQIKEHRTVKKPYCSICGNYGDDEYDKTPYCPYCGAKMDGD